MKKNEMKWRRTSISLAVAAAFMSGTMGMAHAEEVTLDTIVVKGQAMEEADSSYSVTTIDAEQIRNQGVSTPNAMFRMVPGMDWKAYQLGGVGDAITLRGFGSGGHGGDLGVVIDGIPLNEAMSHADGYADLNVLIPLELDSMKVYRGPVSALYGNFNRAGTIALSSRKGGRYMDLDTSLGDWHTGDLQAAWGGKLGEAQGNFAAQVYHTDGYRTQSNYDKQTFSGRVAYDLWGGTQVAVSGRAHHGIWSSPSYITEAEFNDSSQRFGKNPNVQNDGGSKNFYTGRIDVNHRIDDELKLLVFLYGTNQDFTRYYTRPTSATTWAQREETYHRNVVGAGINLNGKQKWGVVPFNWVTGIEAYREDTAYEKYDNLNNRSRTQTADINRDYAFDSNAAFAQGEWKVAPWFRPSLGVRYDHFSGDCSIRGAETSTASCGAMNDYHHTSPKLGIHSTVAKGLELRTSAAEGFALPGDAAKYSSGANVEPTVFRQYEIGAQWKPVASMMFDLAVFRLDSSNEITEYPANSGIYVNFGETRRDGVELDMHYYPNTAWDLSMNLATVDATIRNNVNAALVGKTVSGVPNSTATLQAAYKMENGWGSQLAVRRVGSYFLDTANTLSYGGYTTADFKLTYETKAYGHPVRYYASVENITDRAYATAVFTSQGQTLYAPGSPRYFSVGLSASY